MVVEEFNLSKLRSETRRLENWSWEGPISISLLKKWNQIIYTRTNKAALRIHPTYDRCLLKSNLSHADRVKLISDNLNLKFNCRAYTCQRDSYEKLTATNNLCIHRKSVSILIDMDDIWRHY